MRAVIGFNSLDKDPVSVDQASYVVVIDDFDQPICVVRKWTQGQVSVTTASDPGFKAMLKDSGYGLRVPDCKVVSHGR